MKDLIVMMEINQNHAKSQPVVCEPGQQTCVGGEWSECKGEELGDCGSL